MDCDLASPETVPNLGRVNPTTDVTMPQSINLYFQTGLNQTTLLFRSVHRVYWEGWTIAQDLLDDLSRAALADDDSDTYRFKIGVRNARKLVMP